jgi:uncharacterized alkaline shock family protein YloU
MEKKEKKGIQKIDTKEFELPDTLFVRDIENKVFQNIILRTLSTIKGITLLEGNFIDYILGRDSLDSVSGIHIEQDDKHPSVAIKVEVNICYGLSIPEKAEEIQTLLAHEITRLTGLHVSSVHVIFADVVSENDIEKTAAASPSSFAGKVVEEEYSDEF